MRLSLLVVGVVACGDRLPIPAVTGAELGYISPAKIAGFVAACSVPLASATHGLTFDVTCKERVRERYTWRVAIHPSGAIGYVAFSARTKDELWQSVQQRAPKMLGAPAVALARSVNSDPGKVDGTTIELRRTSVSGTATIPGLEELSWSAPLREQDSN